ncbi:MAG: response regulator transcription factor [Chloroflexi bacterium]|nr:response regulator transcription factor [Chloroflexota bacterium]
MDSIRVLLMNNNPAFLHIITLFLEQQENMTLVGAIGDGRKDLEQIQNLRPQVIVVDMGTPGLTGLKTISILRTMMPDVGIIAMSLLRDNGYKEKAILAGADEIIIKAKLTTDLLPAIRQVAQKIHSPKDRGL